MQVGALGVVYLERDSDAISVAAKAMDNMDWQMRRLVAEDDSEDYKGG